MTKPVNFPVLLAALIGRAAQLSDTETRWHDTLAILKRHGIDPAGYEDYETGRPAAILAADLKGYTAG